MWEQTTWWLVGATALAFTGVSLLGLRDNIVALFVADAAAILLWVLWAIQAFAVEHVTQSGVVIENNYPSLGYLALVFGAVMTLDLFLSVFDAMEGEFVPGEDNQ